MEDSLILRSVCNFQGVQLQIAHPAAQATVFPQSSYRDRGEIGGVYLFPLSWSLHHNFAHDGRYSERGRACTPTITRLGLFTIMMECMPENGHCHSVYSVGYPPYLTVISIFEQYVLHGKHPLKTDYIRQRLGFETGTVQLGQAVRYGPLHQGRRYGTVHQGRRYGQSIRAGGTGSPSYRANHPQAVHFPPAHLGGTLCWASPLA
jgi:hypothetical protein